MQVQVIPNMLSQFKTQYFQSLFENENNYGMTSCPSGKIASLILLGHGKEVTYKLIEEKSIENRMKFLFPSRYLHNENRRLSVGKFPLTVNY